MQIITMNNETTATGYHYAVSNALLEILSQMTEAEISNYMPPQAVPVDSTREVEDYLRGLKKIAIAYGLGGNEARVMAVDIPHFWFDSGWDTASIRPKIEKIQIGPDPAEEGEQSAAGFAVVNVTLPSDGKFRALHDVLYLSRIPEPDAIVDEHDACVAISDIMACGWSVWQFGDTADGSLAFAVGEQTGTHIDREAGRFAVYVQGEGDAFYPITFGISSAVLDVPGITWNGDPDYYAKTVAKLAAGE